MIKQGEWVLAWRDEIRDVYFCQVERDQTDELEVHPLVIVRAMLSYPVQRGILFLDAPKDNPPLLEGGVYRLTLICRLPEGITIPGYAESVAAARADMVRALEIRRAMAGGDPLRYSLPSIEKQLAILQAHEEREKHESLDDHRKPNARSRTKNRRFAK